MQPKANTSTEKKVSLLPLSESYTGNLDAVAKRDQFKFADPWVPRRVPADSWLGLWTEKGGGASAARGKTISQRTSDL